MGAKRIARLAASALAAFWLAAAAAAACEARHDPRSAAALPAGAIDPGLLNEAVRAEVNAARCRAGLPPLADGGAALVRAAADHARWMAESGRLSHRSGLPGLATPADRIRAAGLRARLSAENIAAIARFRIDNTPFLILDAAACRFAARDGTPLPAHSYRSAAAFVVALWMASDGHRRNILAPAATHVATAAAFDATGPYCGRVWFAQLFVG